MALGVLIQTHPAREELSEALRSSLGGSERVVDPNPTGYPSPWRTYRTALERAFQRENEWSHVLILQDDAEICSNFLPALDRIIPCRPDDLICLFVGGQPRESRDAVWAACENNDTFAWLPRDRWVPAIAVIWPIHRIRPALEWVDRQGWPERFSADDEIIGRIKLAQEVPVWATVPNLVEHPDMVPSLAGGNKAAQGWNVDRISCCFIDDRDPLEVDWR